MTAQIGRLIRVVVVAAALGALLHFATPELPLWVFLLCGAAVGLVVK